MHQKKFHNSKKLISQKESHIIQCIEKIGFRISRKELFSMTRTNKLKIGDIVEIQGWVMLKNVKPGQRYRICKVSENTPGNFVYFFSKPNGRKILFGHYVEEVDLWVNTENENRINLIQSDTKTVMASEKLEETKKKEELTKKMKRRIKIVERYGEQDFEVDKRSILSSEVISFYWLLRKNGTVLIPSNLIDRREGISERNRASAIDILDFYLEKEGTLEIYCGDGEKGELKKISKEEMKRRLEKAMEYLDSSIQVV
jgi:hypothetical protein